MGKRVMLGAIGIAVVGALVLAGDGPAVGSDSTVTRLQASAAGRGTDGSRAAALRDLAALDTSVACDENGSGLSV